MLKKTYAVSIWAATWQNQQNECAPSEHSDQPGHPPSLIRVFAVRSMSAQADLSLRWAHSHIVGFLMLRLILVSLQVQTDIWAPSSEFVSSSILSWHILTAHAQTFRGARDLAFCLKVPLDSLLVWASSEGSGETAWMHSLAWTFAARIGDKYQICLTWYIFAIWM